MESTEVVNMKRKYASQFKEENIDFDTNTRQMLSFDSEEETPVKMRKFPVPKSKGSILSGGHLNDSSSSRREMHLKEAEIISLKTTVDQLKNRLASSDLATREARLEQEKKLTIMTAEREREANKMSEIHSKLQYLMEKEKDAKESLRQKEKEMAKYKHEMESKFDATQREKRGIEDKVHAQKQKWQETESNLHDQIIQQKKEIIKLESLYGETQAQLTLRERRLSGNVAHMQEVEEIKKQLRLAQEKVKSLEGELSEHADNIITTKALKDDLDLVPKMKSDLERLTLDNEQLRHNEQNCLLLEEENRSLKQKLEVSEKQNQRVIELEVTNEELQGRLSRWEVNDHSGTRRPQSPSSLSRLNMELETALASAKLKEGELQTAYNSIKFHLDHAQSQNQRLSSELLQERNTLTQNTDLIKRLKRKVLLLSKERDCFKNLLDSYESEVTMNIDAERKAHAQRQEDLLQNYREEVEELETEIEKLSGQFSSVQGKLNTSQQQLSEVRSEKRPSSVQHEREMREAREKIAELEIKLTQVEGERDNLEARIEQRFLQGEYDPSKTKVIHITMNPCTIAQKTRQTELETLRQEVEILRKRNQILEEHEGAVDDLTIQVKEKMQHPSPSKEIEELRGQLKTEEMRNKRLMEVFKKTSQEFRDICYQLTGYKIDIPCSNQYRLTSMYAESPKDYLLFQQNSQGKIQMLETDYSRILQEAMEIYLQQQGSIPLLLSHITMDLFSRQTIVTGL